MRRLLSITISALLLFGAQSCGKIDEVKSTSINCLTRGFADGDSTTIAEWNEGEQICLYRAEDWAPALLNLTSGAGSSSATFSGNTAGTRAGYYAIRPASVAGACVNGTTYININSSNIFFEGENSSTIVPQIGRGKNAKKGLTFTSLFGAVKFKVEGITNISSAMAAIPSREQGLGGTFAYNLSADRLLSEDVVYETSRQCTTDSNIGKSGAVYVTLPAGEYNNVSLLVCDGDKGEKRLYTATDISVSRGNTADATDTPYTSVPVLMGDWHLSRFCNTEPEVELYIHFGIDYSFTIYQRTSMAGYQLFKGTYTVEGTNVSGRYNDGVEWADSYTFSLDEESNLVLQSVNGGDSAVYESATMPKIDARQTTTQRGNMVKPL